MSAIASTEPSGTPARLRIDFVSDVVCPWCVIGLRSLEQALARLQGRIEAEIHFQPFELNPQLGAEGEDIAEHLHRKYGATPEQAARNRENIRLRGEGLGFVFRMDKRDRIYNTFDAHRLLHWAGIEGRQLALQHALFRAYFTNGENVSDRDVLVRVATEAGLPADRARDILASDTYAADVRAQERFFTGNGIQAVPAVIVNERHLISGGQPPEVFESALKQIAISR
ncbi:MAG TPA: DsbA family oxidoreductase [Rudaea sp.]|nr:DsbA family oxidoreductase [Rudaea sp.]